MAKTVLLARLGAKDLRRHASQAVLLFLVIAASSVTLTLGLVLHGVTANPYATTRAATKGPDVVANLSPTFTPTGSLEANANPSRVSALEQAPGVTAHSGPFPVTFALLTAGGITTTAMAEGRDPMSAALDQPALAAGGWVQPGAVVVERSFADALGAHVGDRITLNGRTFHVRGIAVDAAVPAYPHVCAGACDVLYRNAISNKAISQHQPGLIWLARQDAISLTTPDVGLSYLLNLKLADPTQAGAFAASYTQTPTSGPLLVIKSWQQIAAIDAKLINGPRTVLLVGSGLLVVLSLASVAVLVGGRMAEQTRRVGLLKAVGATPGTVAAVLLGEHLVVTLVAAAAGLGIGWAIAPLLSRPGAGLLGAAGAPPFRASTIAIVIAAALALAILATLGPAIRAARTSTVNALADAARPPRRGGVLIGLSARLPVPLLLGVRLAARRPYRLGLGVFSVAVTVAGIVAIVTEHSRLGGSSGITDPQHQRITQVLVVITVMLLVLAAVNALLITWATVLDSRYASALARALGATPHQVTTGLSASQLLSVIPGSVLGVPLGIALLQAVTKSSDAYKHAPRWWILLVIVGTWLVMAALTALPARVGSRRSAAEILGGIP